MLELERIAKYCERRGMCTGCLFYTQCNRLSSDRTFYANYETLKMFKFLYNEWKEMVENEITKNSNSTVD